MNDLVRQEVGAASDLVVVKIGTRVLTGPDGRLDEKRIGEFADQIHAARATKKQIVLVSSGAVARGVEALGMSARPDDLARLQAVAAVGQSRLIQSYNRALAPFGLCAGQVLVTAEDLQDRARYVNVRNTIRALMEFNVVPVINENDAVSTEELATSFGDNDRLASLVTLLMHAPLLVLLSDVDGLYDRRPEDPGAKLIDCVLDINDEIMACAVDRATGVSKGGMGSKLAAARTATAAGENVVIASGTEPNVLTRILAGESIGTLFLAQGRTVASRKRWIGFSARPRGRLVLDDGACKAIVEDGKSLLPIGVTAAEGSFGKGDVVRLVDSRGDEIARGVCNYAAAELQRILGLHSTRVADVLGRRSHAAVVHRDDLLPTG